MAKETKELSTQVSEETLAALDASYPREQRASRISLSRISMVSQDKTKEVGTGKNKKIELVTAAGTFFTEVETDEQDEETGKKIWEKNELGDSFKGIIIYQRKQLRMFEDEKYTQSPIYDNDNEIIPIWCDKAEVGKGTPAELKAKFQYKDPKSGKIKSKLEDNRILYVKNDEDNKVYQLTLRGTSMYAFFTYGRTTRVPAVVTQFGSEPKENGAISWNQMTFKVARKLSEKECLEVLEAVNQIRDTITAEKEQFGRNDVQADAEQASLVAETRKATSF